MTLPANKSYDYVIVGAGSAGCVLAAKLTEQSNASVLLIEAGPPDKSPFIKIPIGLFKSLTDSQRTWMYPIEPDQSGTTQYWPRGKMVGGSSSLNGMLYFRGQPDDYDQWQAMGCGGWGWQKMSQIFHQMEDHELGDDGVRGVGGPLHISIHKDQTPLTEAILQAGKTMGLPIKEDLNRPQQEGIGYSPTTIKNGKRVSAADAFLRPALKRNNLELITDTLVNKINFENKRAVSVTCNREGETFEVIANWEIILSAGTMESPKLLQLSGIGPADHLTSLGIPVVHENPHVGGNIREHKMFTMSLRVADYSLNKEYQGPKLIWNALKYFFTGRGPLASTYQVNAFVRTQGQEQPDAQLTFWTITPDRTDPMAMKPEQSPGLFVMGYPLRTESRGQLLIRSANPEDTPKINANFLTTEHDRAVLLSLVKYTRSLIQQDALKPFIQKETYPGPEINTDEEILNATLKDGTCAHAVGSCKMGPDSDQESVVDTKLRVKGVDGLRVVDCSVMPTQVSGNTNGPVMAIAWRAAELILEDNP